MPNDVQCLLSYQTGVATGEIARDTPEGASLDRPTHSGLRKPPRQRVCWRMLAFDLYPGEFAELRSPPPWGCKLCIGPLDIHAGVALTLPLALRLIRFVVALRCVGPVSSSCKPPFGKPWRLILHQIEVWYRLFHVSRPVGFPTRRVFTGLTMQEVSKTLPPARQQSSGAAGPLGITDEAPT